MYLGPTFFDDSCSYVMGIVNMTPDSFSDGGQFLDLDAVLRHIERLIGDGADVIDVGAESTRPGAVSVSVDEEMRRLEPLLKVYKQHFSVPLSLDTMKSTVAEMGLSYGVDMVNDVSGFGDARMVEVVANSGAAVVVMHSQKEAVYGDVVTEVKSFLAGAIRKAREGGILTCIVDPGIGFGKTVAHNLCLLNHLESFLGLGCPLLVGVSRKSFIGHVTGAEVGARLSGSLAAAVVSVMHGAMFVRVHDVGETRQAIQLVSEIRNAA